MTDSTPRKTAQLKAVGSSGVVQCAHGHELTPDNSIPRSNRPKLDCRICKAESHRRWRDTVTAKRRAEKLDIIASKLPVLSESDLSWAAGLFEGEGTITIVSTSRGGSEPRVLLTMTDRDVIDLFENWFGGYVSAKRITNPRHKQAFTWSAGSALKISRFLNLISPYFRTERVRQKAQIVLRDAECRSNGGRSKDYHQPHDQNLSSIRELNRRGVAA